MTNKTHDTGAVRSSEPDPLDDPIPSGDDEGDIDRLLDDLDL